MGVNKVLVVRPEFFFHFRFFVLRFSKKPFNHPSPVDIWQPIHYNESRRFWKEKGKKGPKEKGRKNMVVVLAMHYDAPSKRIRPLHCYAQRGKLCSVLVRGRCDWYDMIHR